MKFTDEEVIEAGMLALIRDSGSGIEVLLTQRSPHMRAYADYYVFPGGKKEPYEGDRKLAAIRETGEEIGVIVPDAYHLLTTIAKRKGRPQTKYFITLYAAYMPKDAIITPHKAEVCDTRWYFPEYALDRFYEGSLLVSPVSVAGLEILRSYKTAKNLFDEIKK